MKAEQPLCGGTGVAKPPLPQCGKGAPVGKNPQGLWVSSRDQAVTNAGAELRWDLGSFPALWPPAEQTWGTWALPERPFLVWAFPPLLAWFPEPLLTSQLFAGATVAVQRAASGQVYVGRSAALCQHLGAARPGGRVAVGGEPCVPSAALS